MARSTRQAAITKPTRDPAYEPKRVDDKPVFWAYSIVDRLTWPITIFFLAFIGGISAVWLRFGEARAVALMSFLQDNVFYAVVSLLAMATVAVLRKVPQLGRFEKRQAATQQEVEQARAVSEQVLQAVKSAPAATPERVDPTPSEVLAIVRSLQVTVGQIQANTKAAVEASQGAQAAVSGYGASLQSIAAGVTAVTGSTPAQRPADPPQNALWTPGGTGGHPAGYGAPETPTARQDDGYTGDLDAVEDWSRRGGSHRALTSQQAAVPQAPLVPTPDDEHEDWQETDDDGEGLDAGLVRGFRERMAREDELERQARAAHFAAQPKPAPAWPGGTQPVRDQDLPPHIRAARDRARAQIAQERADIERRQSRWNNPEEGT